MAEDLEGDDIHLVKIDRGNEGFGFNVKGTTQEGGTLQAINGRLFPPLQYISHVQAGGAADRAGLKLWDRLVAVNGQDVRGASHSEVVNLILKGGTILDVKVVRVDEGEASRLQQLEKPSEQPSARGEGGVVVKIKDYDTLPMENHKGFYTVFNIYINEKYRTSRRFSEFSTLHKKLKARFRWYQFRPLPSKKLNGLTKAALDESSLRDRRLQLQSYLQHVCNSEDIFNSELMNDFFSPSGYPNNRKPESQAKPAHLPKQSQVQGMKPSTTQPKVLGSASHEAKSQTLIPPSNNNKGGLFDDVDEDKDSEGDAATDQAEIPVEIDKPTRIVLLPDNSEIKIVVSSAMTVSQATKAVFEKLQLSETSKSLFRLFHRTKDSHFGQLLDADELLDSIEDEICVRPWYFAKFVESLLLDDSKAVDLLYQHAVAGVNAQRIVCKANKKKALGELESNGNQREYLSAVRKLETYASVAFPVCDAELPDREDACPVVMTVTLKKLIVQACDEDGQPSIAADDIYIFPWTTIKKVKSKGEQLGYRYLNADDEVETVVFKSPYAGFMEACIKRAYMEKQWEEECDGDAEEFLRLAEN